MTCFGTKLLHGTILGAAFILASALPAFANDPCSGIPNCTLVSQSPISYGADDTKGWAYFCSGDHPYYWGLGWAGNTGRWVQTNTCFSTAENAQAEDTPNKLDVTVTNWCLKKEDYTISLACSTNAPPKFAPPSCSSGNYSTVLTDPNCPPATTRKRNCSTGSYQSICIETWEEQCSNNTNWFCTLDIGVTTCQGCTSSSN